MTFYIVSSGIVSTGLVLNSDDGLNVKGGASVVDTIVNSGGFGIVESGGTARGTVVSYGGSSEIESGGVDSGTVIRSGGEETVEGITISAVVSKGGHEDVFGGVASNTIVSSGGTETVNFVGPQYDTHEVSGTHVLSGGTLILGNISTTINSGQTISAGDLRNFAADARTSALSAITLDSGGTLLVSVDLTVNSGGTAVDTTVYDQESLLLDLNGLASGTVVSSGGFAETDGGIFFGTVISSGGVLSVPTEDGGIASGTVVSSGGTLFDAQDGSHVIDTTVLVGGTIDLDFLSYAGGGSAVLDSTTDVLTVTEGHRTATLQLFGDYTSEFFHLSSDLPGSPLGGTVITVNDTPPCYCGGTRVLTDHGEIAVEDLTVGDSLVTHSGAVRPIRWIGRRSYSGRLAATNRNVLPVHFRPGSLGDGVPVRDLFVSPQHAMFLDGMLVPAMVLVNGTSITQADSIDQVEYFHLELETHDIILAEGASSETFVDDGGRGMFHNAAEFAQLYPHALRKSARYCAPRLEDGPALEVLWQRLAARNSTPGSLQGYVDHVDRGQIHGWAKDDAGAPVLLQITANGVVLGQVAADAYRVDLEHAGIGDGQHSFTFSVPGGLPPHVQHVIEVCRASDGQALYRSPWTLPAEIRQVA